MQIAQLRVRIGDHEQIIKDCTDENPDVAELMRMSTATSAVITIEVPQSPEGAAALGRLVFGKPKIDTSRITSAAEQLPTLSKKLDELDLSVRSANCLHNAGFVYVWEVAEKREAELLKIKDFGRMSLDEVRRVIEGLGLRLGMDLSSIKEHLPS